MRRRVMAGMSAALLGVLLAALPAHAELGWRQTDYITHVGPATVSPLTPEQVRFTSPSGGGVLVRFVAERSQEELWRVGQHDAVIPSVLLQQARAALKGTPVRRIEFQLEHAPAAEIFEAHSQDVTVQVDVRRDAIVRIGRCRGPNPCVLLDQLLATERATDDLLGRTERLMRQQQR